MAIMRFLLCFALILFSTAGFAHKPSDSYLTLFIRDDMVHGQWDIALRDLDYAIGLDANDDGAITWGELRARHKAIAAYALARLQIIADNIPCSSHVDQHLVDNHTDSAYAVLRFTVACPGTAKNLSVGYSLFFDLDPQHRGLLRVEYQDKTYTAVFSPEWNVQPIELAAFSPWKEFLTYGREGVWHIWIGFDHILFLLTLMLPAVLVYQRPRWHSVNKLRPAVIDMLKIVTSFTLAHSITLSLAVLNIVSVWTPLVESTIAFSVLVTALNNLYPLFHSSRWTLAFLFGLVHGFGFANVLLDLGLPAGTLTIALLGFNLGVEVGQIVIVTLLFPIAYLLRQTQFYQTYILRGGSMAAATVAGIWMFERVFDYELLGF